MMIEPKYSILKSSGFKRGYKLAKKQGKDLKTLAWAIDQLAQDIPLPDNWKDHQLKGNLRRFRECHIGGSGDWLLVYEKRASDMVLFLFGTGSQADLLNL
ncbi:MAG: type II toxin-antitoxin system YafQ family toxin [Clostridiales bacterium]|jgi:mRNA interferase YafQ|nr:type II toxin-antitoxin system YafQ family toxin [Clostridiales bacterium]